MANIPQQVHSPRSIEEAVISHAANDYGIVPPDTGAMYRNENSLEALRGENLERLPTLGSELSAMFREGIKDVRQTLNETYFGHGEHAAEPGAPLSPTIIEINESRHEHDFTPRPMDQGHDLER